MPITITPVTTTAARESVLAPVIPAVVPTQSPALSAPVASRDDAKSARALDVMDTAPRTTGAVEREMRDLAADVGQLASAALAATETIKQGLRSEIDALVVTNTAQLATHKRLAADARTAWGNTTLWDTMCSRMAVAGTTTLGWVDALEQKATRAEADAASLEARMRVWTTSIGTVELEVKALEQTAQTLATPAPAAQHVAALRAHAGTISSLGALEANLERQVKLLTTLRDAGVDLQGTLKSHIDDLQATLADAAAAKARSLELFKVFVDIVCAADPRGAAHDYLQQLVADRVRDVLHEAGVTPEAFADQILKGTDPAVAAQLRPRLVEAFSAALPPVFSTGRLDG